RSRLAHSANHTRPRRHFNNTNLYARRPRSVEARVSETSSEGEGEMTLIAKAIAFYESEESRAFLYMITHDPFAVIGLFLIGASAVLFFHVLLSLERAGDKSYREGISLPVSI